LSKGRILLGYLDANNKVHERKLQGSGGSGGGSGGSKGGGSSPSNPPLPPEVVNASSSYISLFGYA
jgi:hypothetical protein